jgi:hypothetical protein
MLRILTACLVACSAADVTGQQASRNLCDPDNGGLTLPQGFCRTAGLK